MKKNKCISLLLSCCLAWLATASAKESTPAEKRQQLVSNVDTSLEGAQKYVLRVKGMPFYMTNIQVRLDLLRYSEGWDMELCDKLMAQIAADGFNTVSVPVHWYEVEPEKGKFDWTVLDSYLELVKKHGLKMEMLWFGANSGGHVQWLGRPGKNAVHLRTPDYVLYSSSPSSKETTSEFTIRRDMSDYTLDIADDRLRERETYVLGKVMEHIVVWDMANGKQHPIIGVQINNEFVGQRMAFPNSLAISYLNSVAGAVKQSDYVVWTRANCVFWNVNGRIYENEAHRRSPEQTNLDFVGIDTYRHHFPSDASFIASMRNNLPYVEKNFRMIMETNSGIPVSAQMHLAALSGNAAFDYYSVEALYGKDGDKIVPLVKHLDDIRRMNKVLLSDPADLATKAHGYGLFVHNWEGVNSAASTSNSGITYVPAYPTSQGISIQRSDTEVVLMSTGGGRFTLPKSIQVKNASYGYFDKKNQWVKQGDISLGRQQLFDSAPDKNSSISMEAGSTVLLICNSAPMLRPYQTVQAEFASFSSDVTAEYDIKNIGFAGNGYAKLPSHEGAYIIWKQLEAKEDGEHTLRIRYSLEDKRPASHVLTVNGKSYKIKLQPTGEGNRYDYFSISVPLRKGKENVVRLETEGNYFRPDRVVVPAPAGNIDELQIL